MLTISEAAREYIKSKGNTLKLVSFNQMSLCCGRIALEPSVELGRPKDVVNYRVENVDGVEVYIPKDFYTPYALSVELKSWFKFKVLRLNGWKLA